MSLLLVFGAPSIVALAAMLLQHNTQTWRGFTGESEE
jgi:hypothetical protein